MDTYTPDEGRMHGRDEFPRPPSDREEYRRRSPGPYQDRRMGRPRNRSRSPMMIDRYQPDPRSSRDDYYSGPRGRDDRRRPPSPGAGAPSNIDRYVPGQENPDVSLLTNPVMDPLKLEVQVGFSYFAEWWRREKSVKEEKERQRNGGRRQPERLRGEREVREERDQEKAQIQAAYDSYKEELQSKMARAFVQAHKNDEWFKERYVPEVRDPLIGQFHQHRRKNYEEWENDFISGVFDDFTLEGIPKSESDGVGGILEKEEGETIATGEVLGVADLVPTKGGDIRDPAGTQTALLIKTISPTVSRTKLEGFCKEHLGDGPGGFKWLSLSDPNPSKRYHRIGWIVIQPGGENFIKNAPESPETTNDADKEAEAKAENEQNGENGETKTIAAPIILGPEYRALEAVNAMTIHDEVRGDFICHVGIHNPPTALRKKALWDLFSAPERISRDLDLATKICSKFDSAIGSEVDGLSRIESKVEELRSQGLLKPIYTATKATKIKAVQDLDVDGFEDEEEGEMDEDEGMVDDEVDDEEILVKKKTLDLLVEYFRRVHHFCFFCVFESDSVHELARKCPGGHLRRPRASLTSSAKRAAKASAVGDPFPLRRDSTIEQENGAASPPTGRHQRNAPKPVNQLQKAYNWVKTFEDKLLQLLDPESTELKKLGGMALEDALDDELPKFVKQEDENKWRCKVPECTKLFKADHFWRKHVEKRHPEWFENLKSDLTLVNTYVLDPSHIAPSRSDANSNGHFPPPSTHFAGGTPRGFNLNVPMGFGMMHSMGPPGMLPPFMGPHAVSGAGGAWAGGMGQNGDDRRGGIGPVRRGGGYARHQRTGPYDRRPSDSRDPRWGNGRGGGGDMRGGRSMSGGGRWGDGAGMSAIGPREAVQGRSIRSYEDLDAVGGGGGGELNY
ncbi:MAG: hypothetical protein M1814_006580 [Vezdaea aestivalis]|nr:MAG: hypothetical protein M1814_006580 [Vezdaea aestivalis]